MIYPDFPLELIVDTPQQLKPSAQGAFLQTFLKSLAGVDVSEKDSLVHWQGILRCYREMNERLYRLRYLHRGTHAVRSAIELLRCLRIALSRPSPADSS